MIGVKRVLALIPARGGSKGLPCKNVRLLKGKPLVAWPIETARKSRYVDTVICSTDDEEIARVAEEYGAGIPFLRPKELAGDESTSAAVIEHALQFFLKKGLEYDYLVLLEPTSPLTEPSDVENALEELVKKRNIADSIVGVCRVEALHPDYMIKWLPDGRIRPAFLQDFSAIKRRQEILEIGFFEGSLYISDARVFLEKMSFYHDRTLAYIVPRWKSLEVDNITDLICIEAIINNLDRIRGEINDQ